MMSYGTPSIWMDLRPIYSSQSICETKSAEAFLTGVAQGPVED